MLLLNLAKYSSNTEYQTQLMATVGQKIEALPSTANWTYWNTKIQLFIRQLLIDNKDLSTVFKDLLEYSGCNIEQLLRN